MDSFYTVEGKNLLFSLFLISKIIIFLQNDIAIFLETQIQVGKNDPKRSETRNTYKRNSSKYRE